MCTDGPTTSVPPRPGSIAVTEPGDSRGSGEDATYTVPVVSGGERETVRTTTLVGVGGSIAEVSRTPTVSAHDAIERARTDGYEALQSMPIRKLCRLLQDASLRFEAIGAAGEMDAYDETDSYEAYLTRVTRATGLPRGWVRSSAHWLGQALRHVPETLRAQSPTAGLDVYDDPSYTREHNVHLSFAPRVRVVGAVMPGNDPAVYGWPLVALAMKIPVVIRPSDREPFTAIRLARALRAAGVPGSAFHVLPGPYGLGEQIVSNADHGMIFGDEAVVAAYRDDPTVEAYGPGNSVAVVGREPTDRDVESLARGIYRGGGRACFNLTRIVATDDCDPDDLAGRLAAAVADRPAGDLLDDRTDVPGFPDGKRARRIDAVVDDLDGRDVTAGHRDGPRLWEDESGTARLVPTVVRADGLVDELPFPFVGVTDLDREELFDRLDGAYLGVAIGDEAAERRLVRSPGVPKVYAGRYPASVDLRQTHEQYLASFLYTTQTYDRLV